METFSNCHPCWRLCSRFLVESTKLQGRIWSVVSLSNHWLRRPSHYWYVSAQTIKLVLVTRAYSFFFIPLAQPISYSSGLTVWCAFPWEIHFFHIGLTGQRYPWISTNILCLGIPRHISEKPFLDWCSNYMKLFYCLVLVYLLVGSILSSSWLE